VTPPSAALIGDFMGIFSTVVKGWLGLLRYGSFKEAM
jgi:hypothetical protein